MNSPAILPTTFRLVLALLAVMLGGCVEDPAPKLRVGAFQRPGSEPIFLARSLGWLDARRVELVEFPTASEMLLGYRNHAIDAALMTTDDVLRLAADGHDPRIVLVLAWSRGADAVLARPGVADMAALRGQKVAVESNALGGYVLARGLDTAGLTVRDVNVVSVRSERIFRELQLDNVTAAVAGEPYRGRLLPRNVKPIFDTREIPNDIADLLVVPAAQLARHAAVLRSVEKAWYRALAHLGQRESESIALMAPRHGSTLAQFHASLLLVEFVDRASAQRLLAAGRPELLPHLDRVNAFMARAQLLPHPADTVPLCSDVLSREAAR